MMSVAGTAHWRVEMLHHEFVDQKKIVFSPEISLLFALDIFKKGNRNINELTGFFIFWRRRFSYIFWQSFRHIALEMPLNCFSQICQEHLLEAQVDALALWQNLSLELGTTHEHFTSHWSQSLHMVWCSEHEIILFHSFFTLFFFLSFSPSFTHSVSLFFSNKYG